MIDLSIYDYCYDFKKHFKEILKLAQKLMQSESRIQPLFDEHWYERKNDQHKSIFEVPCSQIIKDSRKMDFLQEWDEKNSLSSILRRQLHSTQAPTFSSSGSEQQTFLFLQERLFHFSQLLESAYSSQLLKILTNSARLLFAETATRPSTAQFHQRDTKKCFKQVV